MQKAMPASNATGIDLPTGKAAVGNSSLIESYGFFATLAFPVLTFIQ
jgi:hypothetical protein